MAQFASDAFTGTSGTELTTYSASWTLHTSYSGLAYITDANRMRHDGTTSAYYHSGSPASADYSVSADQFFKETDGGDNTVAVAGRISTSANTMYFAAYSGSTNDYYLLRKIVAGTVTTIGSTSAASITDETSHNIKLEMVGSAIKLYKDGSGTATVSTTDTAISAAGKAGVRFAGATAGNASGIHLDNFSADDIGGGATTLTGAGSTQADTSTTGAIGQTHVLTGANSAQADTSATGAITQEQTLTGAGSTQADTSSTGAISNEHVLTGAGATQADTSSTGSVAQTHVLAGANAAQADTSNTGAVSQTHVLTGSNAAQGNLSSTGAIGTGTPVDLTGSNCTQANSCSDGAIEVGQTVQSAGGIDPRIINWWLKKHKKPEILPETVEEAFELVQEVIREEASKPKAPKPVIVAKRDTQLQKFIAEQIFIAREHAVRFQREAEEEEEAIIALLL